VALNAAEKRLAKAIEERTLYASKWAMVNAEIPSLQQTIVALRRQQNPAPPIDMPGAMYAQHGGGVQTPQVLPANYGMDQILSDAPLPFAPPQPGQGIEPEFSQPTLPPQSRAMGGAIAGLDLGGDEPAAQQEDEDVFLKDSGQSGGSWV